MAEIPVCTYLWKCNNRNKRNRGVDVDYRTRANRRWPDAEWITGDGPHAVLAHCDVLTVTLHVSERGAQEAISLIDKYGCGHNCCGMHEILPVAPSTDTSLFEGRL